MSLHLLYIYIYIYIYIYHIGIIYVSYVYIYIYIYIHPFNKCCLWNKGNVLVALGLVGLVIKKVIRVIL